ncbi:unnamed protein product [Caenorhabditis auriculariae]|uniref:SH2 domain-containing protein n=1 Tax=Caenorhabditis auriculariae TaxID=2777116 RepID=A0A8S1HLG9_9PELO|nr:unnamed protein product [Caenorhabditis auriculariae]
MGIYKNDDFDVEKQSWYHGFRPRRDVEPLLPEPGDFLVRATDARTNNVELVLSVKSNDKGIINLTIVFSDGKWHLGILKKAKIVRFDTIPQLIEYYRGHRISSHLILKRPVARPDWLIKHEKVTYNPEKDKLGTGNFCDVYKGTYARDHNESITVAVKICHQGQAGKVAGGATRSS